MGCMTFPGSITTMSGFRYARLPKNQNPSSELNRGQIDGIEILNLKPIIPHKNRLKSSKLFRLHSTSTQRKRENDPEEDPVEDLRVPNHWLRPSKASEESEWLRVTLHNWLDDEYCPEETNIKISKVASDSFYKSLMEKKTDLGEILLEMVQELSTISYQESFHGAFSSANAAVNLITQRIQQD